MTLHFIVHRRFSDREKWHGWTFQENVVCLWMGEARAQSLQFTNRPGMWCAMHHTQANREAGASLWEILPWAFWFYFCFLGCIRQLCLIHVRVCDLPKNDTPDSKNMRQQRTFILQNYQHVRISYTYHDGRHKCELCRVNSKPARVEVDAFSSVLFIGWFYLQGYGCLCS